VKGLVILLKILAKLFLIKNRLNSNSSFYILTNTTEL